MISPTIPRGSRILPIKNLGRWLNVLHSTRWPWWPCADWCLQPDGMANQRLFRYDPVRFRQLLQHAGLLPHLGVPDQDNLLQAFETRLDQLVAMWEANDPSATRTTTPFPKFKHQPRRTMALKWLMEVNNIGAGGMSWGNFNGNYPRNSPQPEFCQSVLLAYWHLPVTFRHFHPSRADLILEWLAQFTDSARTYPFDRVHDSTDEATERLLAKLDCVAEPLGPGVRKSGGCATPQFYWDVGMYENDCWEGCLCCL